MLRIGCLVIKKKWGFKFDILILDYFDCLESHKKYQDRNESELTIIKGFEALSSDFDIPAWTAIQSNRCLNLNSKVNIEGIGEINIGDVKIGNKILTVKGYKTITNVFPITKQKTYKIKTKSGKEIICSANHKFLTSNNKLKSINSGLSVGENLFVRKISDLDCS